MLCRRQISTRIFDIIRNYSGSIRTVPVAKHTKAYKNSLFIKTLTNFLNQSRSNISPNGYTTGACAVSIYCRQ